MAYIPPKNSYFKFTSSGYLPPDFDAINFNFTGAKSVSDIKATIKGMEFEYDYLKSCDEYIVGYNQNAIQILRSNCVYGGIRDLKVQLDVLSHFQDLPAYLKQTYTGQFDIIKAIKGWNEDFGDVANTVKGWAKDYKDVSFYIKQGDSSDENLSGYLKIFTERQKDLHNVLKGWSSENSIDIINTIRIWNKDIQDVPVYLKSTVKEELDLPTVVHKIWQHQQEDLNESLHGWQDMQLKKIIRAFNYSELPVAIRSTYFINLVGLLQAVLPIDIGADIRGWDINNLSASIVDGAYGGDLKTSILGVGPKDLPVSIYSKIGIETPVDLNFRLTNLKITDLCANLNTVQFKDLSAYLNSSRSFFDIQFKIYPKVINIKHHINISFLECRDLAGIINFPCFGSAFKDLSMSLVIKNSKDLRFSVYGHDYSNIVDLKCSINASDYSTMNTLNVRYFNDKLPITTTTLKYEHKQPVYSFNVVNVWTNTFKRSIYDLSTSIVGDYVTKDLKCFVRPYSNPHYKSRTREYFMSLKLKNNKEDFRRYVEVAFNSYSKHYTYFSDGQKTYKEALNDNLVVRVEGHELLPVGRGYEKTKIRRKYIFKLDNYSSIDEAIKDMIDRVTNLKTVDLGVFIESSQDKVLDLNASLEVKRIYKSNRGLRGVIKTTDRLVMDLPTLLYPTENKGEVDLLNYITPVSYDSPLEGVVDFEFTGTGDMEPSSTDAQFSFDLGDTDDNF